jgi:hypothetical protein
MDEEEFQDELDEMLAEFCVKISDMMNEFAAALDSQWRVRYITCINGTVVKFYYRAPRLRLFGIDRKNIPPGRPW